LSGTRKLLFFVFAGYFLQARTFGDVAPGYPRETERLSSQAAASPSMMQDRERAMLSIAGVAVQLHAL
jgi:hypothetical protein